MYLEDRNTGNITLVKPKSAINITTFFYTSLDGLRLTDFIELINEYNLKIMQ